MVLIEKLSRDGAHTMLLATSVNFSVKDRRQKQPRSYQLVRGHDPITLEAGRCRLAGVAAKDGAAQKEVVADLTLDNLLLKSRIVHRDARNSPSAH